jgi:hypothetical protein
MAEDFKASWPSLSLHENFDTIFYQNRDIGQIIRVNQLLASVHESLLYKGFAGLNPKAEVGFTALKKHYKGLVSGSFNVFNCEPDFRGLYENIAKPLIGFVDISDYIFVDDKAIKALFPLDLIIRYLEFVYFKYGYWLYEDIIRLKSVLLNVFTQFHFKADTKFHLRLDALSMRTMDPCYRIHVRQVNRADKAIQLKYFLGSFHIKNFITQIAAIHFPSITWRALEPGQFIHLAVLQLINSLFELGLWTYSDIPDVLDILLPRLENIIKLENASVIEVSSNDGPLKNNPRFKEYIAYYLLRIRLETAKIIIHIIALINDHAIEYSMPWSPKYQGQTNFENILDMLFIEDSAKSNVVYYLITHFLLKENRVEDYLTPDKDNGDSMKWKSCFSEVTDQLSTLTMSIFELMIYEQNDPVDTSNKLLTSESLDFYLMKSPNAKEYITEAYYLKLALVDIFEELKTIEIDDKQKGDVLCVNLIRVLTALQKSISRKRQVAESAKTTFCLALDINNFQIILLSLGSIVSEHLSSNSASGIKKDCLHMIVKSIWECTISIVGQSSLFSELGSSLFFKISSNQPILSVMLSSHLFKSNIQVLNNQEYLFNTLIKNYQQYVDKVTGAMFHKDGRMKVIKENSRGEYSVGIEDRFAINQLIGCILSIILYNKCFNQIMDDQVKNGSESNKLELKLQRTLSPLVCEGILKGIMKNPRIFTHYEAQLNIDYENDKDLLSWSILQRLDINQLIGLIREFSTSLLATMSRCTSQVYFGSVKQHISSSLDIATFHSDFEYLTTIPAGPKLRASLLKLVANTYIFSNNSLLTKEHEEIAQLKQPRCWNKVVYDSEYPLDKIVEFLTKEFTFLEKWSRTMAEKGFYLKQVWGDVEKYCFVDLLLSVYKLAKGYMVTSTISYHENINNSIKDISRILKSLKSSFQACCHILKNNLGIDLKIATVDALISMLGFGDHMSLNADPSSQPLFSKEKEANHTDGGDYSDLQADELVCRDLVDIRNNCKEICRTIEENIPAQFAHEISGFDRPTALRVQKTVFDNMFKSGVYVKKRKYDKPFDESDKDKIFETLSSSRSSEFEKYQALTMAYRIEKYEWLNDDVENNSLYRFLNEHKESTLSLMIYLVTYFTKSIEYNPALAVSYFNSSVVEPEPAFIVRRILENPSSLSLITFIDRACKMISAFRSKFFESLSERTMLSKQINRMMVIILTLYKNLLTFCFLKTFHDKNYRNFTSFFDLINDILINFCDKNNIAFKNYYLELGQHHLLETDSLPEMLMSYIESITVFMELGHLRKTEYITMVERPENYNFIVSILQLVAEMANGPHIQTQAKVCTRDIGSLTSIAFRVVEDINSEFYNMKWEVLNYFQALTEQLNNTNNPTELIKDPLSGKMATQLDVKQAVVNYVCNNIKPNGFEEMIVILIKKLYIYLKVINKKGFKDTLDLENQGNNGTEQARYDPEK